MSDRVSQYHFRSEEIGSDLKLVHITTVPFSSFFIRGQPRYMKQAGIETIYITSPSPILDEFSVIEECETRGVPMSREISPISDLRSLWKLIRTLRDIRPEIVHAHTPKGGLLGMISSTISRVPVRIYNIQGLTYMGFNGPKRRLMMATERIASRLAHQVICVSPSIAEVAVTDGIVPVEKIKVLENGTANGIDAKVKFNPDQFSENDRESARADLQIDQDAIVVTFVGRLAIDKGIRELTAAWESVVAHCPTAILVLVGDLDERDPVDIDTMRRLQRMASVRLVGHQQEILKYYVLSDIFVLPTYREGFPTVLLEAAAMTLPAVATRIPGCVDAVVDNETGLLVPVKNSHALSAALMRLTADGELRRRMGAAARVRVENDYRTEVLWSALLQEYRRLSNPSHSNKRVRR